MIVKPLRDRSNDVVVVEVKSGRVAVDNMRKYYPIYYLNTQRPGTVEYLRRERDGQNVIVEW